MTSTQGEIGEMLRAMRKAREQISLVEGNKP
jgi:hypothetical protein